MIEIQNLVYKEDDEAKCFISENFNFIYSKINHSACSWGRTKEETPQYNPISPESIIFKINENFTFIREQILKLISLKPENDECVSCINSIIIDGENYYNNVEVKNLIKFIDNYKIPCFLKINFKNAIDLREIFKIKYLGIKNVILKIDNDFSIDALNESMINLQSNGLLVNYEFNLISKNMEKFIELLKEKHFKSIYTKVYFGKPAIKKNQLNEVETTILTNKLLDVIFIKPMNSKKKYKVKNDNDEAGLFNCIIDFVDKKIYCDDKNSENFVNISDVSNLNDYWNSLEFNEFRKKNLKGY
jgi:hypothetical protein